MNFTALALSFWWKYFILFIAALMLASVIKLALQQLIFLLPLYTDGSITEFVERTFILLAKKQANASGSSSLPKSLPFSYITLGISSGYYSAKILTLQQFATKCLIIHEGSLFSISTIKCIHKKQWFNCNIVRTLTMPTRLDSNIDSKSLNHTFS